MKLKSLLFVPAAMVITNCSASQQFCGEAFCLTEKPSAVAKQSPNAGFNLYRVEYGPSHYVIYEGDHPNTEHDQEVGAIPPNDIPKGFVSGTLRGGGEGYQIVLRTANSGWPEYIAVSMITKNPDDLKGLLAKLTAKQPAGA
jgi:hypothetical protein